MATCYDCTRWTDASDDECYSESECGDGPEPVLVSGVGGTGLLGLPPRFDEKFPERLASRVAPEEFRRTLVRVNSALRRSVPASRVRWLALGAVCCCCCTLGCSLWPAVYVTRRAQYSLHKLLQWENLRLYNRLGLHWRLAKLGSTGEYVLAIEFLPRQALYAPD